VTDPRKKPPVDKALELFVYAPLGVTLYLKDAYPMIRAMLVNRGRSEVEQRQHQVTGKLSHWKNAGEVALAFGPPEIKRRVGDQLTGLRERASGVGIPGVARTVVPEPAEESAVRVEPSPFVNRNGHANGTSNGTAVSLTDERTAPPASTLPIPGYDELSASQVVERLSGLGTEELEAVRDYERAGRARKTILGRIDQLVS